MPTQGNFSVCGFGKVLEKREGERKKEKGYILYRKRNEKGTRENMVEPGVESTESYDKSFYSL